MTVVIKMMSTLTTATTTYPHPVAPPNGLQDAGRLKSSPAFPSTLPSSILDSFPKLTRAQAGHIRHFHNLATLQDGDWRHMGCFDPGQENFEAYRYQIATMSYATGVTHYHRLPALRSVFRTLLDQLIHKMLRRDVWAYWYLTSQSGTFVDPDLTELRKPWPDPVRRENIMYSGHLLLMVSLHAMLFDSDRYEEAGALTFDWNPMFFGFGPEKFPYCRSSLQKAIVDEMERSGWMGVCCEPNCVFIICNQFPLIAMRYNDVRNGTDTVSDALEKYTTAWKEKTGGFTRPGMTEEEEFIFFWRIKQDAVVPNFTGVAGNGWASAFMNAWNSEYVHKLFPNLVKGYLTRFPDGRVSLNNQFEAKEIRDASKGDAVTVGQQTAHTSLTNSPSALAEASSRVQKNVAEKKLRTPMGILADSTDFGFAMQWISEVAPAPSSSEEDGEDLVAGLLKHADAFLNPTWEQGGLFYPRKDGPAQDEDGNWITMDPYTGNAAIAYGRLNVRDGQKKMWEQPWTREGHHANYPTIEGVDLSSNVDFLRGEWKEDLGALVVTMRTWDGSDTKYVSIIDLYLPNLPISK